MTSTQIGRNINRSLQLQSSLTSVFVVIFLDSKFLTKSFKSVFARTSG